MTKRCFLKLYDKWIQPSACLYFSQIGLINSWTGFLNYHKVIKIKPFSCRLQEKWPLCPTEKLFNCSVFKERWPAIGMTVKQRWHSTNEINWKLDKFWVSVLWYLMCAPCTWPHLNFFYVLPIFDQKPLWLQQYRPQEVKYFWPKVIKSNKAAYWTKLSASVRTP